MRRTHRGGHRRMKTTGKAWLIGAGPGDPELLTLKAVRALGECDVLFVDDLANPAVLAHARYDARRIAVGKRAGCRSTPQEFIERSMVHEARSGLTVGRVKGGDPFVFGRGGEEMLALRAAGIEVEIASGVTAGCAVPAALGIPVTHRDVARSVTFVTAHTRDGEAPDYAALARVGGTLVFYMGLGALDEISAGLVAGGLPGTTPACVVSQGTLPRQASVVSPLDRIALDAKGLPGPALIVVGDVVNLANRGQGRNISEIGVRVEISRYFYPDPDFDRRRA
ncbi:uroporphyrinogen-III C-methyltransferase [Betaproteobacteria bacterium GR16-43]|nr:uroporphyrinogen-III C-methyltransferase [Betaproteobacteria bacterium GR16-43]